MTILSFIASLCTTGAIIFLFVWDRKRGKEISALQAENECLKSRVTDLEDKFKAADELIESAKEREEEAARSERLFQDGLTSIVNYDYMTATKGKNGNGER